MEVAVQALIILLDYGHPLKLPHVTDAALGPGGADMSQLSYVSPDDTDAQGFNVFRRILSTIESPDQLLFIFRGFSRLLNNVHESESSYLPYSVGKISIEQVNFNSNIYAAFVIKKVSFIPILVKFCRNYWCYFGSAWKRSRNLCLISFAIVTLQN